MSRDLDQRLQELEEACRRRGLPLTVQRRTVFEVLLGQVGHPTADQIFEIVRERNSQISRRTVYRVLDTLVDLGLVRRVHHPGASARYDAKTHRHHHLVCTQCHKILDLESPDLDEIPLPKRRLQGFEISDFSVQLMGVCPSCRKERTD